MAAESTDLTTGPKRSWSWVDLGAATAVVLAAGGVIWSPKLSTAVAKATGALTPVTVSVDLRGVPVANPSALIAEARKEGKALRKSSIGPEPAKKPSKPSREDMKGREPDMRGIVTTVGWCLCCVPRISMMCSCVLRD